MRSVIILIASIVGGALAAPTEPVGKLLRENDLGFKESDSESLSYYLPQAPAKQLYSGLADALEDPAGKTPMWEALLQDNAIMGRLSRIAERLEDEIEDDRLEVFAGLLQHLLMSTEEDASAVSFKEFLSDVAQIFVERPGITDDQLFGTLLFMTEAYIDQLIENEMVFPYLEY